MSQGLCWKLDQEFKWQMESDDEQSFAIQVFNMFNPMVEGKQVDFFTSQIVFNKII